MGNGDLKVPFPWFGGKSRIAQEVWAGLGDVENYVEPFGGGLSVLLMRPIGSKKRYIETVNDADGYIANFWRAVKHDPEKVVEYADNPVNETDLFARHLWLVNEGKQRLIAGLEADPDFFDAKIAGWWVWGICCWIGGEWCSGTGPWKRDEKGQGVSRRLPHLSPGQGVNRQLPHLGRDGQGNIWQNCAARTEMLIDYMQELSDRLRDVRVCAGDWSRLCTNGVFAHGATVGVFLDPPYDAKLRDKDCYNTDSHGLSAEVRQWAIEAGDDPKIRIALAGYHDEHDMPAGWRMLQWTSNGSYQTTNSSKSSGGNTENRHKETIWFSPHCLEESRQIEFAF
ncbi:MAG: DNA adenine methylase [Gammaproteobacteria bacterium]|nr:DNA adenine methylase [Gammaproteobacteria bacterium]MDH3375896.1 DNA adenine methylase [Gammaproteobacteria bacterium]